MEEPVLQDFTMPGRRRKPLSKMKGLSPTLLIIIIFSGITSLFAPSRPHPLVGAWEFVESSVISDYDQWFNSWMDIYFADGTGISSWDGDIERFVWAVQDNQIIWAYGLNDENEVTPESEATINHFHISGSRLVTYNPDDDSEIWIFQRID